MEAKKVLIYVGCGLAALVIAFSAGRYSAPAKVVEREKEVEKLVIDQEAIKTAVAKAQAEWKANEKVRTVIKTVYKDGKPIEKIVYVDREKDSSGSSSSTTTTTEDTKTKIEDTKTKEKERIVEAKQDRWRLGVGAGVMLDGPIILPKDLVYEVHGELRVVGGVWAGISALPQQNYVGITLSYQQ